MINWKVNNAIRAPEVRVIGADGKQIGVLKIQEALDKAREAGLDLVEIAPNANPPVAKIIHLGKLRYQEEKKLRKEKRGAKGGETKEIRFSPFIAEGDYQTKIERIKEFFGEKNKVRVVVKFGGRQMGSKEFGYNLIRRIISEFGEQVNVDMQPKFLGRHLTCVISPKFKTAKISSEEKINHESKTEN